MGFHGYGGSELDHSECTSHPCSACRSQLGPPGPSVQAGNAFPTPTSTSNIHQLGLSIFGSNQAVNSTTLHRPAAGNTENLSGIEQGIRSMSLSEEGQNLRERMRLSGFRIPSAPTTPRYTVGSHNSSGFPDPRTQRLPPTGDYATRTAISRLDLDIPIGRVPDLGNMNWNSNSSKNLTEMTATPAPWASRQPTTQETLRQALLNKKLAATQGHQDAIANPLPSPIPESSTRNETGSIAVPMARLRRMSGVTMDGSDTLPDAWVESDQGSERWAEFEREELKKHRN